jgi:V/A-type H+-transporting ATPase subunit A
MGKIRRVFGPIVIGENIEDVKIHNMVNIGDNGIIGEVIEISEEEVVIQSYESTDGLKPGDKIVDTKNPLMLNLGPGLIGNIFDGIGRPLNLISKENENHILPGSNAFSLDEKKEYNFIPSVKKGQYIDEGQIIGEVVERDFKHKILCPIGVSGKISSIKKGRLKIKDSIGKIGINDIYMYQKWHIKKARPVLKKIKPNTPLITGRRIIDTFFPIVKGGTACIPGPFGAGKTMTQQDIAKWCDADLIVYIGCGERGNEMTEVLEEFPTLIDPRTKKQLIDRTIMIANTSNMPVAAREASIYTGITIAEYFRDQGYNVALMADSTSRWAEAMREISARLEEIPKEEGYPANLSSRLANFYERAGNVKTLSLKESSVTVIGAVSPQGGDFSEPVTQNTKRITNVFWALDSELAYQRHFPSINWLLSYSKYNEIIDSYLKDTDPNFIENKKKAFSILQKESELKEIVQLIGADSLSEEQKIILYIGKIIKEDFLQQNSLDKVDAFCSFEKSSKMIEVILHIYNNLIENVNKILVTDIEDMEFNLKVGRMKYDSSIKVISKIVDDFNIEFKNYLGDRND